MDYESWIGRERKIRQAIIKNSSLSRKNTYRVCTACDEICLCHEEVCPHCNACNIVEKSVQEDEDISMRIRCLYRYKSLEMKTKGEI